jgi:hypothetical protein
LAWHFPISGGDSVRIAKKVTTKCRPTKAELKDKLKKKAVGTLKDWYVCNVPLPRVPQRQSVSHMMSHELIAPKVGIPIPGYLQVPSWIPTLPKLGSILGFSQRLL